MAELTRTPVEAPIGCATTVTVAVVLSAVPAEFDTRTQKFVMTDNPDVVNVAAVAPATGADVSPLLPWYHW
jgi:hypothetical protein